MRAVKTSRNGGRLQNPTQFAGLTPAGIQYSAAYPQQAIAAHSKSKPATAVGSQQQQQLQQQQQQQQYLAQQQQQQQLQQQQHQQQQQLQSANLPSYADQMQAAFLDYQRQRLEFEQQQQQLLQKLYTYYPDVSGQQQHQLQHEQQQQQPQQPQQSSTVGSSNVAGNRYFARQSTSAFGNSNGLQPQQQRQQQTQLPQLHTTSSGGLGNFYSTQQHMGFLQQQQQDVLRDQQQNVAQQFATGQLAPSTTTNYGMAVPETSVLGSPSYQPSSAVSHVRFSSGNLNYNF
ncbi:probable basic-leucine zipper transcription factor Q [Drosophila montana]|uniref:probable basic-leucine zipper transcription factor Q n=1 Tax=Drosophila montana TaxID=40370 RepID=UPI00313D1547